MVPGGLDDNKALTFYDFKPSALFAEASKGVCDVKTKYFMRIAPKPDATKDDCCWAAHSCPVAMLYSVARQRTEAMYVQEDADEFVEYCQYITRRSKEAVTREQVSHTLQDDYFKHLTIRQRKLWSSAIDRLVRGELSFDELLVKEYCAHHNKECWFILFSSFSKTDEKLCCEDFKNRNITAPSELMKVVCGMLFWWLQDVWDREYPQYCLRANAEGLALKLRDMAEEFSDPVLITLDGSRFDSSQYPLYQEALNCPLYLHAIESKGGGFITRDSGGQSLYDLNFLKTVSTCIHQKVWSEVGTYKTYGTTPSGRNNTTEGNTYRSMCYVSFLLHKTNGSLLEDQHFLVKGDDMLICLERSQVARFQDVLDRYCPVDHKQVKGIGIPIKDYLCSSVHDLTAGSGLQLDRISFCSMCPIQSEDGSFKFVRQPSRVIAMYAYTASTPNLSLKKWQSLCASNARSFESWGAGLPIIRALIKGFDLLSEGASTDKIRKDHFFNRFAEEFRVDSRDNRPFLDPYYDLISHDLGWSRSDVLKWERRFLRDCEVMLNQKQTFFPR